LDASIKNKFNKPYYFIMNDLKNTATQIRRDILRMVHGANSGHPGGSLGCADYFAALFLK